MKEEICNHKFDQGTRTSSDYDRPEVCENTLSFWPHFPFIVGPRENHFVIKYDIIYDYKKIWLN